MIYTADKKGPFRVPGFHDKDNKRLFGLIFRPQTWGAATVYSLRSDNDYDVIIPTVFTGLYYKVKAPGKSGATEPVWNTIIGKETIDGTTGLIWEAVAYNLLPISETISTVNFGIDNNGSLSGTSFNDTSCQFFINTFLETDMAVLIGYFNVICHVYKSNGEIFDVTLKFKLHER